MLSCHQSSFETGCNILFSFKTGMFSFLNRHHAYLGYPVSKLGADKCSSFETGHSVLKLDQSLENPNRHPSHIGTGDIWDECSQIVTSQFGNTSSLRIVTSIQSAVMCNPLHCHKFNDGLIKLSTNMHTVMRLTAPDAYKLL